MRRIPYVALLTALSMFVGAAAFAQSDSAKTTEEKKENPAEEKKETPAQERAEEKTEAKAAKAHATTRHKAPKMVLDLNSATKEELTKVSGITDEIADKIIAGRPYKSRGELISKSILTKAEYAKVRARLTVKKTAAAASK